MFREWRHRIIRAVARPTWVPQALARLGSHVPGGIALARKEDVE